MAFPRNRGAILLEAWRRQQGLTQFRAAVLLDMDPSPYSKYELGKKTPGLTTALRIAQVTKGAVPAEAWHASADADAKRLLRAAR